MRTDKGIKHRKLKPFVSKELDTEFMSICKRADWIKRVHKLMSTIKANGMYSHKEMNLDRDNMELMNVPDFEKKVLLKAWEFRVEQTKTLCLELDAFIDKCLEDDKA